MKKNTFLGLLLISSILFIANACKEEKKGIFPEYKEITEAVYSSAKVKAYDQYNAFSLVNGIVEKIAVSEGDIVKEGDLIIKLSSVSSQLLAENARLSAELAQQNYNGRASILSELENELKSTSLVVSNDSLLFIKQSNLWAQNIGSKVEFDQRKLAFEISKNKLKALQNNYQRTKLQLSKQAEQAQNQYGTSAQNAKEFEIRSKINGRVFEIKKEIGEMVSPQEPVALIGAVDSFIVDLSIDEVDIRRVQIGQRVFMSLDAFDGQVFEGVIGKIYPRMDSKTQTFKIESTILNPPKKLFIGLSGEANILINKKSKALCIPIDYITADDKAMTKDGLKDVKIGLRSLTYVEILSGIDEKTELVKSK